MSCSVFANSNGLFHKGSGGSGAAYPDVCLSPPPPPAGPIPVPYPNKISAADLTDGSTTVKIQGEPTALKDQSSISTSTGDEGGTQGGGVITHKTQGKAVATFWSIDVKIQGKNAVRHGDPAGQNTATPPWNGLNTRLKVVKAALRDATEADEPCPKKYSKSARHNSPNDQQKEHVNQRPPQPKCWECRRPAVGTERMIADHQPPCVIKYYAGGCHEDPEKDNPYKEWCKSTEAVRPHCSDCSPTQGGLMSALSKTLADAHGLG